MSLPNETKRKSGYTTPSLHRHAFLSRCDLWEFRLELPYYNSHAMPHVSMR